MGKLVWSVLVVVVAVVVVMMTKENVDNTVPLTSVLNTSYDYIIGELLISNTSYKSYSTVESSKCITTSYFRL